MNVVLGRYREVTEGIVTPEDAMTTICLGLDGMIVSNHGGRTPKYDLEVLEKMVGSTLSPC